MLKDNETEQGAGTPRWVGNRGGYPGSRSSDLNELKIFY
jgi:hypothetical protein